MIPKYHIANQVRPCNIKVCMLLAASLTPHLLVNIEYVLICDVDMLLQVYGFCVLLSSPGATRAASRYHGRFLWYLGHPGTLLNFDIRAQ